MLDKRLNGKRSISEVTEEIVTSNEFILLVLDEFPPKTPRKLAHIIIQPLLVMSKKGRMGRIKIWRYLNVTVIFRKEGNIGLEYQNTSSENGHDYEKPGSSNMTKVIPQVWLNRLPLVPHALHTHICVHTNTHTST